MEKGHRKIGARSYFGKHQGQKDLFSLIFFVVAVIIGTVLLNMLVFRSYNVVGGSMENTLHTDDRMIVNRLAVSWEHLWGREYIPERGQIVVFAHGGNGETVHCDPQEGVRDQYIIKRVIAFAGERVKVKDGQLMVWTDPNDDSTMFYPDESTRKSDLEGPKNYTSGELDIIVPAGEIFVSGDNRVDVGGSPQSYDSRNGLGTVPYCRIIGPVAMRLLPLDGVKIF